MALAEIDKQINQIVLQGIRVTPTFYLRSRIQKVCLNLGTYRQNRAFLHHWSYAAQDSDSYCWSQTVH
jgi:hypothetical protein